MTTPINKEALLASWVQVLLNWNLKYRPFPEDEEIEQQFRSIGATLMPEDWQRLIVAESHRSREFWPGAGLEQCRRCSYELELQCYRTGKCAQYVEGQLEAVVQVHLPVEDEEIPF